MTREEYVETLEKRFWSKVTRSEGCWEWNGYRTPDGYGRIWKDGKGCSATRISWEMAFGSIPDGLHVLHRCDNPPCVNPDHLFLGDRSTNMQDSVAKGRNFFASKTHCKRGHAFTADNTMRTDRGARRCRTCERTRWLNYYYKHRVLCRALPLPSLED